MPRIAPDTRVLVFAKAPQPGSVKTRLIPVLGEERAAALHEALVRRALATATSAYRDRVTLYCAPDTNHPFFHACTATYGVRLTPQATGNLGDRMRHAFDQALKDSASVILIGSDCPALTAAHLLQAGKLLQEGDDAVFAPAEDGGYGLVALRRCAASLFENIAWGGQTVMEETRARLRQLAWSWRELATVWDVDRPADYERLVVSRLLSESTAFMQKD